MTRRIVISVSSDLVTDQRVHRTAITLKDAGYHVLVIGRVKRNSPEMPSRRYRFVRLKLLFEKGPFFYISLNFRIFWFLLWNHVDILFANDLDTLLPNYLISKIRRIPVVYDSHEYFTGVPELTSRPAVQKIWKRIEKLIVPKLSYAITVNDSIALLYKEEYNVNFQVLRNLPLPDLSEYPSKTILRKDLGLPADSAIYILQGAGINVDRGAEEAVEAMQYCDGLLLIVGDGDVIPQLKENVIKLNLQNKVKFVPRQISEILNRYTRAADVGLTLDKDTNINYRFSLPNKLFDYIHAGIPVIASNLPEVKKIIYKYKVGLTIDDHHPQTIAAAMQEIIKPEHHSNSQKNLKLASEELNWSREKEKLVNLIKEIP